MFSLFVIQWRVTICFCLAGSSAITFWADSSARETNALSCVNLFGLHIVTVSNPMNHVNRPVCTTVPFPWRQDKSIRTVRQSLKYRSFKYFILHSVHIQKRICLINRPKLVFVATAYCKRNELPWPIMLCVTKHCEMRGSPEVVIDNEESNDKCYYFASELKSDLGLQLSHFS